MIDDFRLMIEKKFTKSAIADHKSKMLLASIQTRQEMLSKLGPACAAQQSDAAVREVGR